MKHLLDSADVFSFAKALNPGHMFCLKTGFSL